MPTRPWSVLVAVVLTLGSWARGEQTLLDAGAEQAGVEVEPYEGTESEAAQAQSDAAGATSQIDPDGGPTEPGEQCVVASPGRRICEGDHVMDRKHKRGRVRKVYSSGLVRVDVPLGRDRWWLAKDLRRRVQTFGNLSVGDRVINFEKYWNNDQIKTRMREGRVSDLYEDGTARIDYPFFSNRWQSVRSLRRQPPAYGGLGIGARIVGPD